MSGVPAELASTLRRLRTDAGISQAELVRRAQEIGGQLSPAHVGQVEAGTRNLSAHMADLIAVALELDEKAHRELLQAAGHGGTDSPAAGIVERLSQLEERFARLESQQASRRQRGRS